MSLKGKLYHSSADAHFKRQQNKHKRKKPKPVEKMQLLIVQKPNFYSLRWDPAILIDAIFPVYSS